jgi:uncharacterized repeat protein (TIGR02543 family)
MKHGLFIVCAFVFLVTAGCPMPDDTADGSPVTQYDPGGQDNPGEPFDPTGSLYAETYWGEWIRMDADETWYISGGAIKINGAVRSKSVSLEKQSERVVKVTEGGREYYLYASRIANASFTGKIAGFEEASASVSPSASLSIQRAAGWGQQVKENVETKVKNKNNGSTQTVQTDDKGEFTVPGAIPGDPYEITPEGGTPVTVTPLGDGDDVGTITVTEGVNFKTRITENDNTPYLYANGTRYDFTLEITNTGTVDCLGTAYQLSFEDGLVTQASTERKLWGTIEFGKSKTVELSLQCDPIEEEYVYKKITITVTDVEQKTWVDSVTVKFYKTTTYFYLETAPSAAAPVYGVVINPYDNKASRFQMAGVSLSYVTMPWSSSGYLVVFSGATVETEAAYALGANRLPPYSDSDFENFYETWRYEPNGTEQTAVEVTEDGMMAYLHKNDIDYYRCMVPCPESEPEFEVEQWSVTFDADGGDPATQARTVYGGNTVGSAMPSNPTRSGNSFGGWYTQRNGGGAAFTASVAVTADITVYAKWGPVPLSLPLAESLAWLSANTVEGGAYAVTVSGNETIGPQTLSYGGKHVAISLDGGTVDLSSSGALFTVGSGVTLKLGNNITLQGRTNNSSALVQVNSGGTLEMNSGSKISANYKNSYSSGNSRGGGVFVDGGRFTMNGGFVSGNSGGGSASSGSSGYGGGVYVSGSGEFTMNDGTVSGNSVGSSYDGFGGGVYINSGTFTMSGGTISGNSVSDDGGGVYVGSSGTFTMTSGTISGNTASGDASGGGVYVSSSGRFTMSGGTISGNSASGVSYYGSGNGGGVYASGEFIMDGGTISGNTASGNGGGYGGGVYVSSGTFTKQSGGIIYGSDADSALKNTASSSSGHAVYVSGSQMRNVTVGAGKSLDSTKSGAEGGWTDQWAVTFDADGGSPATQTRTVNSGSSAGSAMPSNPTKSEYAFAGWYTQRNGGGAAFTASTAVTANITVYAKWMVPYTVTFDADGGSPAAQTLTVPSGNSVGSAMPSNPTRSGYFFGGWYTQRNGGGAVFTASTVVSANVTVYATWGDMPPGTLAESLAWLSANAVESRTYTITLSGNETIGPLTLSCGGKYVTIALDGGTAERTVSLSSTGSLFTVGSGVTLRLGNNITLRGLNSNTSALVRVNSGGTLEMNSGSKISGNSKNSYSSGSSRGGGVFVDGGRFTMNGGYISGNTGGGSASSGSSGYGGGVYVSSSGEFTMNDGTISGNSIDSSYGGDGGGVYVSGGTFTMSGGTVSGNSASGNGGGVYVSSGTFAMSGGTISGNAASKYMGNDNYVGNGGGVCVYGGTFTKQSGGTIYGNNYTGSANTSKSDNGHAVYVSESKKRNSTAGEDVTLDSAKTGAAGGWE